MNYRVVLLLLVSAAMLAACSENSTPRASETAGPNTPALGRAATADMPGSALVYSALASNLTRPDGGIAPRRSITVYDVRARKALSSFEVGTADDTLQNLLLAGRRVVALFNRHIVSYALDGSDARTLRRVADGEGVYIISVGASPDGTKIALTEQRAPVCSTPDADGRGTCSPYSANTDIVVIDAADGRELLQIPQSEDRFAGFVGQAALPVWRDDGLGFVVSGYTHSEYYGGLATVMLDGTVTQHDYVSWPYVAPNGRHVADGELNVCSLSLAIERQDLRLRDLDTDRSLNEINEAVLNIEPVEWSPDASEFLYRTYMLKPDAAQAPCKAADELTATWHILPIDGSPPLDVANLAAARRRWYGDRFIEYRCAGVVTAEPYCLAPNGTRAVIEAYLDGGLLTTTEEFSVLGFVQP